MCDHNRAPRCGFCGKPPIGLIEQGKFNMATARSALKPNLKGRGGPNRGQGRKAGVLNEKTIKKIASFADNARYAREKLQPHLDDILDALLVEGGVLKVPLLIATGPKQGEPKQGPLYNDDGSPKLDDKGRHMHGTIMVKAPAASDSARVNALVKASEMVVGKPNQSLSNDPDNPITDIKPSGKVIFGWPEGYAPPNDGKNRVLPHEVAQPANDDDEGSADEPEEKNT